MSNKFKIIEFDFVEVQSCFKNWKFSCFKATIGNQSLQSITVFCCQTENLNLLKQEWKKINNVIAATYIVKNESSFERWNTYLLFICTDKDKVPQSTHYEIENNKFSMRKMVVQEKTILNGEELENILNQKILSSGIELIKEVSEMPESPQLFEVTERLLSADINTKNASTALEGRKAWLDSELKRISNNEN